MKSQRCERFDDEGLRRLDEGLSADEHEQGCEDCQAAHDRYVRMITAFAQLPTERAAAGWQQRVLDALPVEPTRARGGLRWLAWPAAAAAAALLVWKATRPELGPLSVRQEVVAAASGHRADSASVGDTIRISATGGAGAVRETRLYRNTSELVARCPGDAGCKISSDGAELTFTLTVRGSYRTLAIAGPEPVPEPTGALDEDARAAVAAGASVELSGPLEVE